MITSERQLIEDLTLSLFHFLEEDKGFNFGTIIKRDSKKHIGLFISIVYRRSDLGIEIYLDFFDMTVGVTLLPLINGTYPDVPFDSRKNWAFGEYVQKKLGITDPMREEIRVVNAQPNREVPYFQAVLPLYRDFVLKYIDVVNSSDMAR